MKNRNHIYDIIRSKRPETIDELQRQLFVTNQYLLDLYRQYSTFWWHPTIPNFEQVYQEAWKDWEMIWTNEQAGKVTPPINLPVKKQTSDTVSSSISCCELNPTKSSSFSGVTRSSSITDETIPSKRRFSAEYPRKNDKITMSSEYPRNNDTIPSSMQAFRTISTQSSNAVSSSTSSSSKSSKTAKSDSNVSLRKGSSWRTAVSKLNRKSGNSRSNSQIIERELTNPNPDSVNPFSQPPQQQQVFNAAPLAVRQLSTNEIKKLDKAFILRLRQSSPLPLHIEIASIIQKHLQMLFAQTKSALYQKLFSHLQSWYQR